MSRVAVALVTLAVLAGPAASGEDLDLPKTTARLVLPDGWQAVHASGVVVAYRSDAGALLAVTRADVPNPDAYKPDKKRAYADQIERGIKATIAGYKRTAKKLVDAGGVPALDLEARRAGGAIVVLRVLLFRTYALSLAIELPAGSDLAPARAIVGKFVPAPVAPGKP